jgi:hypothetical protein
MGRFVRPPPNAPADVVWIAGGEVDEYHISLGFFGDELDPDEVSRLLGGTPTSTCRKGDVAVGKATSRIERTGRWLLAFPVSPGEPLEPQLLRLFASLSQDASIWRSLTARYKPRLSIGAWIRSWNRGLELSPELLSLLSERGLGVGVDIYADFEDHDV